MLLGGRRRALVPARSVEAGYVLGSQGRDDLGTVSFHPADQTDNALIVRFLEFADRALVCLEQAEQLLFAQTLHVGDVAVRAATQTTRRASFGPGAGLRVLGESG